MTELLDALTIAGETVSEVDRVVYLLASLPDTYNVLVTALEANEDVPKLEVVAAVTQENSDSTSEDSGLLINIADQALSVASLNEQYV